MKPYSILRKNTKWRKKNVFFLLFFFFQKIEPGDFFFFQKVETDQPDSRLRIQPV